MRCLPRLLTFAILVAMLSSPTLDACPLCKDAISSPGSGDDEINNAPLAYNQSIYLMAGMPYLLLGFFGFMIYRGCKKNALVPEAPHDEPVAAGFSLRRVDEGTDVEPNSPG